MENDCFQNGNIKHILNIIDPNQELIWQEYVNLTYIQILAVCSLSSFIGICINVEKIDTPIPIHHTRV